MVDFVLEQSKTNDIDFIQGLQKLERIYKYANFIKQPLQLWMFVACYLRNGIWIPYTKETLLNTSELFNEWEQAKERCLFDGFEFTESQNFSTVNKIKNSVHWYTKDRLYLTTKKENGYHSYFQLFTVEDLVQCDLQLTPTALKQIGL